MRSVLAGERIAEQHGGGLLQLADVAQVGQSGWVLVVVGTLRPKVRGRGAQDLETVGTTVLVGRTGDSIVEGHRATVALVADDGVFGAEHVAIPQIGVSKEPVLGCQIV